MWKLLGPISFAICAVGAIGTNHRQTDEYVELTFLDVGQGDAIVIRSPEGKVALVDAGRGVDVVALLRQRGIDSIDIAIASHAHADHIGGMEQVVRSMPVRYYMDNGVPHTTATYLNLMRALNASDITYLEATERNLSLGSVTLRVIPPPGGSDQNNNSIGLVVEYGEFTALLTGDSEVDELQYFLTLGVPDVAVLKAAHHGSGDAVTRAWLSATKPELVVISCGANNQYGHPHEWALRYYNAVASRILRTDRDGAITIHGREDGSYEILTGSGHLPETVLERRASETPAMGGAVNVSVWVFPD